MKPVKVITTVLTLLLTSAMGVYGNDSVIELTENLSSDPLILNGTSGGANKSNCGSISSSPNQVFTVKPQQINYLRVTVEGEGQPTLMIKGPKGNFCVFADQTAGEKPEISGVWVQGNYNIFVGDRAGGNHPYKLYITQKRD